MVPVFDQIARILRVFVDFIWIKLQPLHVIHSDSKYFLLKGMFLILLIGSDS